MTGEKKLAEKAWITSPIKKSKESTDKVLREAAEYGFSPPPAPRNVHIGTGSGKIGNVEIEAKARNQYVKVQGEFAMEIMHEFVNDPDWDSYPPIQKKLIFSRVYMAARQQATAVALPEEVREQEAMRIARELQEEWNQ